MRGCRMNALVRGCRTSDSDSEKKIKKNKQKKAGAEAPAMITCELAYTRCQMYLMLHCLQVRFRFLIYL
jgi:hypothetical protein